MGRDNQKKRGAPADTGAMSPKEKRKAFALIWSISAAAIVVLLVFAYKVLTGMLYGINDRSNALVQIQKECSAEALERDLKGPDRVAFQSSCLKEGADAYDAQN